MRRTAIWMCTLGAAALVAAAPALGANADDPDRATDSIQKDSMQKDSMQKDGSTHENDSMNRANEAPDRAADREREGAMNRDTAISRRSDGDEYVVKEGDTLADIAKNELGSTDEWTQIASANGIDDPKQLRVGQKLKIPSNGKARSGSAGQSGPRDTDESSMR